MNGTEPPMPILRYPAPNTVSLACPSAADSHGASGGALQPSSAGMSLTSTLAPKGTSVVRIFVTASAAAVAPAVGGVRRLSVSDVQARSTFPTTAGSGSPAAPITDRVGRHV